MMIVAATLYRHNPDGPGTLEPVGAFRSHRTAEEVADALNSTARFENSRTRWFVELRGFLGRVQLHKTAEEWFEDNGPKGAA